MRVEVPLGLKVPTSLSRHLTANIVLVQVQNVAFSGQRNSVPSTSRRCMITANRRASG